MKSCLEPALFEGRPRADLPALLRYRACLGVRPFPAFGTRPAAAHVTFLQG